MTSDEKQREWWIRVGPKGSQTIRDTAPDPLTDDSYIHVIEKSAYDRVCELADRAATAGEKLKAERDEWIAKYKNIELANKEWTRNDAVTFGKLYERIEQCKQLGLKHINDMQSKEEHIVNLQLHIGQLTEALEQICHPDMNPNGVAYGAIEIAKRALQPKGTDDV